MTVSTNELIRVGVEGGFYILLLIFSVQALFLAYHWFTYGSSRHISTIALALYLGGGSILLLTISIALNTL